MFYQCCVAMFYSHCSICFGSSIFESWEALCSYDSCLNFCLLISLWGYLTILVYWNCQVVLRVFVYFVLFTITLSFHWIHQEESCRLPKFLTIWTVSFFLIIISKFLCLCIISLVILWIKLATVLDAEIIHRFWFCIEC